MSRLGAVTTTATLVASLAAVGAAPVAASADAAPQKCKGRIVTVRGTADDDRIIGTPGRDVIRAGKGDDVIKGRGGNDVICGDRGADTLIGGAGNDRLHGGPFKLIDYEEELGAEGDRLIGGHGNDRIFGGGNPSNENPYVAAFLVTPDRVEFPKARGGITVGKHGVVRGRGIGHDLLVGVQRLTGTKWADHITVRGEHVVAGKGGDDRLRVVAGERDPQVFAKVVGQHGNDRINLVHASRKHFYELYGGAGLDRITGSKGGEYISDQYGRGVAHGLGGPDQISVTSRINVNGGGGKDLMQVAFRRGRLGSIDGGARRDRFELTNPPRRTIRANLRAHRLGIGKARTSLTRVENLGLPASRADVRFVGSGRNERLTSFLRAAHRVRARMGAGDDEFDFNGPYTAGRAGRAFVDGGAGRDDLAGGYGRDRLLGGRGNDDLWGGAANDVLRGGRGHDDADGDRGKRDLCRAEKKRRCER